MPSSSFTFSREGPTFCTALRILAGSVSSVRAQKSSASGLSSICVGSGGVYFAPCLAMWPHGQKRGPHARASRVSGFRPFLLAADPPDHAGLRDLHERAVVSTARVRRQAVLRRAMEDRARIALAEVAHRAVVDEVERVVGPEHRRYRPIYSAQRGSLDKRLVVVLPATGRAGRAFRIVVLILLLAVECEARLLEPESLAFAAEVDQLDVVPCRRLAVLFREPEIALA